jgi:hypothetical protein
MVRIRVSEGSNFQDQQMMSKLTSLYRKRIGKIGTTFTGRLQISAPTFLRYDSKPEDKGGSSLGSAVKPTIISIANGGSGLL